VISRDLHELREALGDCHRCPLGDTRTTLVFGVGDSCARVMLVGEAPGRNEDLEGEPFVGAAGRLLDELLSSAGLSRGDIYIANVLKCRPPKNRDPKRDEIECCAPFLREQIRLIDPAVVVTLGNYATRSLLDTKAGITTLHGRPVDIDGRTVLPVFHPAATIYDRTKRDDLFADFAMLGTLLSGGGA
jgi:uracil-DNA glycosylase family 4